MSLLALIMWAVLSGGTVVEYGKQPLDQGLTELVSTEQITHTGFSSDDQRQAIIQKAYNMGGLEFVLMLECENGNWSINARWDHGHAYWLCQINDRYHKIPSQYFTDWEFQLDYCYQKWSSGTPFYGPTRKIKWQKCKDYVLDRFVIKWSERKT